MMKNQTSISIWMAVAAIVVKLIIFSADVEAKMGLMFTVFTNLFVILIGTFFAVRLFKMKTDGNTSFIDDVKAGMRVVALYAVMMAIFVFIYYNYIDVNYFPNMIADRVAAAQQAIEAGVETDIQGVKDTSSYIFSPKIHATATLFGFSVVGLFYSLLISFFMRKVPGFK